MTTLQDDLKTICIDDDIPRLARNRARAFKQLVEIARKHDIGYTRTVALLLKHETESQQSAGTTQDFMGNSLLAEWPITEMTVALQPHYRDDPLFADGDLTMLMTEMVLLGLHTAATDSDALQYFDTQRRLTIDQSSDAEPATKRLFAMRKRAWLRANEEYGSIILRHEDSMLRAEMLRQAFLQLFSVEFIAEKEQSARLEIARLQLELIRQHPELDADQIRERLKDEIEQRVETLRAYQLSTSYGLALPALCRDNYDKQDLETAKHLLRRIAMLTHPDRLQNLDLTREQRRQLGRIWKSTHALRGDRDGQGMLCRSIPTLEHKLEQAQQILALAGIEGLDAALTIQGDTLEERIAWLESACAEIDQQIVAIQAEIFAVSADGELKLMRAMLDMPEARQEEQREQMKVNAEECRKAAEQLEKEADELLSITPPPPGGLH
ncbi:MAG: hypothetical protein KJO31_16520 [Gammaproteobacteria bacterium]|nr:hypothetical protein [Gammaproteobacteria bacterium]